MMRHILLACIVGCGYRGAQDQTAAQQQSVPVYNNMLQLDETQTYYVENGRWMINRLTNRWEYVSNSQYQEMLEAHKIRIKKMCEKVAKEQEPAAQDLGDLP
jgi:hypothetical protein